MKISLATPAHEPDLNLPLQNSKLVLESLTSNLTLIAEKSLKLTAMMPGEGHSTKSLTGPKSPDFVDPT